MNNLFSLALQIKTSRYITQGLQAILASTACPMLPIHLQQKADRLLVEHKLLLTQQMSEWTGPLEILDAFITHLDTEGFSESETPAETEIVLFIQNMNFMIKQVLGTSMGAIHTSPKGVGVSLEPKKAHSK